MDIKPIRNEKDYESTFHRIDSLMDAEFGSEAFDELEILTTLIENYEAKYHVIDTPRNIQNSNLAIIL